MDTLVRTETTRYVHSMFDAIKDRVKYVDTHMMLRHQSSDAHMEGRNVVIYELEIGIGEQVYTIQEQIGRDMQEQGYWQSQESAAWRRLCVKVLAAVCLDRPGFREGLSLPAWLT